MTFYGLSPEEILNITVFAIFFQYFLCLLTKTLLDKELLGFGSLLAGIFLYMNRSRYMEWIKRKIEDEGFQLPFILKLMKRCFCLGDVTLKPWTFRYCLVVAENFLILGNLMQT